MELYRLDKWETTKKVPEINQTHHKNFPETHPKCVNYTIFPFSHNLLSSVMSWLCPSARHLPRPPFSQSPIRPQSRLRTKVVNEYMKKQVYVLNRPICPMIQSNQPRRSGDTGLSDKIATLSRFYLALLHFYK